MNVPATPGGTRPPGGLHRARSAPMRRETSAPRTPLSALGDRAPPRPGAPVTWAARMRRTALSTAVVILALSAALMTAPSSQAQVMTTAEDRAGVPEWTVDPAFAHDVFTFARVRYTSWGGRGWGGWGGRGGGRWATDYPDAELNLAFRLQQMTSLKVNPDAAVVDLGTTDLSQYPFLYIVEPGRLVFSEGEITALRRHLLNGGFLMIDDFWGDEEWENIRDQMARVFPGRELVDLPLEHPIFHCVFDLKEKPQVPSIHAALGNRGTGITWERDYDPTAREVHYRAYFDDKGRMMVIICQNTDLGDGWEREGESAWYFQEFAEKRAYPMAINIIFWAMTH